MGKSKNQVTVGFKYFATMHYGIAHGPIDKFRAVWFGEKIAWTGDLAITDGVESEMIYVENAALFGGDESEGGVEGWFEFGFGGPKQTMTGVLSDGTYDKQAVITRMDEVGTITNQTDPRWVLAQQWRDINNRPSFPDIAVNYRGLAVCNLYACNVGNNAYMKDLSFDVERYTTDWYVERSKIYVGLSGDGVEVSELMYGMNPAHIIREAYINDQWGLGNPVSSVDDVQFAAAADQLYAESFGLSMVLADDQAVETFIDEIKETINATTYSDPQTNKFCLRLIRPGDPVELTISPDNFKLTDYKRKAIGETYNEISAKYVNPANEQYQSTTVHDLANIQAQGTVAQMERTYIGVRSEATAQRLAQRDLLLAAATMSTVEGTINQSGWKLVPGSVVEFSWPDLGIVSIRMRVVDLSFPAYNSADIRLSLSEDVFGQEQATFTQPQEPGSGNVIYNPTPFDYTYLWELPFWFVMQRVASIDLVAPEDTYSTAIVADPTPGLVRVNLYKLANTPNGQQWQPGPTGGMTPTAVLQVEALAGSGTMTVAASGAIRLSDVLVGDFFLVTDGVNEEICQITALSGATLTVDRGLMDTPPRRWPISSRLYFIATDRFAKDSTTRSVGELVTYKPAMITPRGEFSPFDVPEVADTLSGRFNRPYPPGDVKFDGQSFPAAITKTTGQTIAVTWAHRNRLLQQIPVQIKWSDASITPEAGTSYHGELRQGSLQLGSFNSISGTTAQLGLSGAVSGPATLKVWSMRDGDESIKLEHTFNLTI